jgi:hypothetical protein
MSEDVELELWAEDLACAFMVNMTGGTFRENVIWLAKALSSATARGEAQGMEKAAATIMTRIEVMAETRDLLAGLHGSDDPKVMRYQMFIDDLERIAAAIRASAEKEKQSHE